MKVDDFADNEHSGCLEGREASFIFHKLQHFALVITKGINYCQKVCSKQLVTCSQLTIDSKIKYIHRV